MREKETFNVIIEGLARYGSYRQPEFSALKLTRLDVPIEANLVRDPSGLTYLLVGNMNHESWLSEDRVNPVHELEEALVNFPGFFYSEEKIDVDNVPLMTRTRALFFRDTRIFIVDNWRVSPDYLGFLRKEIVRKAKNIFGEERWKMIYDKFSSRNIRSRGEK